MQGLFLLEGGELPGLLTYSEGGQGQKVFLGEKNQRGFKNYFNYQIFISKKIVDFLIGMV